MLEKTRTMKHANITVECATPSQKIVTPEIIKGVKYGSVWFDNQTKKEMGLKWGTIAKKVETGRKFRLAETRVCDLFELVSPPPKYKNGKYYINYNGGSAGSNKQKVEIWVLVEDETRN
jgi:hypothetical protein